MSASDSAGRAATAETTGSDQTWTVLRLILWSADYLREKGIESGRLDAEHLLAHALGVDRLRLYLDFERPLIPRELDVFRPLLRRRAAREPLQYVLGHQPFRELDLKVAPGVLIPRPETEVLVGLVLDWVKAQAVQAPRMLEVGAGSGAICLSLAHEGYDTYVMAIEISDAALEIARHNRETAGLGDRVEFRAGSIFDPVTPDELFDVVVSNPPYVAEVDEEALDPEVRDWEPKEALFAGEDGLDVIRRIVGGAPAHLKPGGLLALEVGSGQTAAVAALARETGRYEEVRVLEDWTGRQRFVLAHRI